MVLAVTATGYAEAGTRTQSQIQVAPQGFDLDNGNAAFEVIFPRVGPNIRKYISATTSDATLVIRVSVMLETSWFEATAPYHPTAVGIYSDLGRRPAREATRRNINIAMLYSSYRVMNSLMPGQVSIWREMLTSVGLDPDDNSLDRATALGLGNLGGNAMVRARKNDGMNQLGDAGGRKYFQEPYADYTGYEPVNTPYAIHDASRWQPQVTTVGNGIFKVQQFVTPQMAYTKPFSFAHPREFLAPPPVASNPRNRLAYKRQADEVLAASANLTDEQKLKAELFNDKLAFAQHFPDLTGGSDDLLEFIHQAAAFHIATFDALIVAWYNKIVYDAVRPVTAIFYLYGDKKITAWGGPGKGTVTDLPANQWHSYLSVADHPEYISGTTVFCGAAAQIGRRWTGSETTDYTITFAKGSSYFEPGVTPAQDTTLHWSNWTDMVRDCGMSRVWGGVHFKAATNQTVQELGAKVGDRAYALVQSHIRGERVSF